MKNGDGRLKEHVKEIIALILSMVFAAGMIAFYVFIISLFCKAYKII